MDGLGFEAVGLGSDPRRSQKQSRGTQWEDILSVRCLILD